jgi:hypothetical protein
MTESETKRNYFKARRVFYGKEEEEKNFIADIIVKSSVSVCFSLNIKMQSQEKFFPFF